MYEKCDKGKDHYFIQIYPPADYLIFKVREVTQAYEISFHSLSTNLNLGVQPPLTVPMEREMKGVPELAESAY